MNDTRLKVRAMVESMRDEQIAEFQCQGTDIALWLETELDLPSITTDKGLALADYAEDLIWEIIG